VGDDVKAGFVDLGDKIGDASAGEEKDAVAGQVAVEVKMNLPGVQDEKLPQAVVEPTELKEEKCEHCGEDFSFPKRKHACRWCSKTFCGDCSPYRERMKNPAEPGVSKFRLCGECELKYVQEFKTPTYEGTAEKPLFSGLLQYRVWTGLRDWTKRFAVLDFKRRQVSYYKVPKFDSSTEQKLEWIGGIPLLLGTSLESGAQNQFNIIFPNGYEITFQAADPSLTTAWRHALTKFIEEVLDKELQQEKKKKDRKEAQERATPEAIESAAKDFVTMVIKRAKDEETARQVVEKMLQDARLAKKKK